MIIFDNVYVEGFDHKKYILNFHIPLGKTTLVVMPSGIDKIEFAKYIIGLSKPISGSIIREIKESSIKPTIYIPEQLANELLLMDILNTVDSEIYREIVKIIKSIGYEIYTNKYSIEIPDIVKKLVLILYTLYSARYLTVLIEPYLGLDKKLLSLLSYEFKRLNSNNLTIIVLTSNMEFLKTDIDLYDYAIVIESENVITEGDREKYKSKPIFAGLEIYEVWSSEKIIDYFRNIEGFNGYLKIDQSRYMLFIDSRYRWNFLIKINELYRNRVISMYKHIDRKSIGV